MNLIDYFIKKNDIFKGLSVEQARKKKQIIKKNIKDLEKIFKELEKEVSITNKVLKSSQLRYILEGESGIGTTENYWENLDSGAAAKIGVNIYKGYHLTSKILQNLGAIPPVKMVVIYNSGKNFYRAEDIDIDPEEDLDFEIHKGNLVLRFKRSVIKQKVIDKNTEDLSSHFKDFNKIIRDYFNENFINEGVISEAFERHLEEKHPVPDGYNEAIDAREALKLYRESSGNDPYYTGPDTNFSQVKNINASIISNAETVLNAMKAVLQLANKEISEEKIEEVYQKYSKSFQQKQPNTNRISRKLWEALTDEGRKLLKESLGLKGTGKMTKTYIRF